MTGLVISVVWTLAVLVNVWMGFATPEVFDAEKVPLWARVAQQAESGWAFPAAAALGSAAFLGSLTTAGREHSPRSDPSTLGLSLNLILLLWCALAGAR
jgi:hypothetical protein